MNGKKLFEMAIACIFTVLLSIGVSSAVLLDDFDAPFRSRENFRIQSWLQRDIVDNLDALSTIHMRLYVHGNNTGNIIGIVIQPSDFIYIGPVEDFKVSICEKHKSLRDWESMESLFTSCEKLIIPEVHEKYTYYENLKNFNISFYASKPEHGEEYEKVYYLKITFRVRNFVEPKGKYYIIKARTLCSDSRVCPETLQRTIEISGYSDILVEKLTPSDVQMETYHQTDKFQLLKYGYGEIELWFSRISTNDYFIPLMWAFVGAVLALFLEKVITAIYRFLKFKTVQNVPIAIKE